MGLDKKHKQTDELDRGEMAEGKEDGGIMFSKTVGPLQLTIFFFPKKMNYPCILPN